MSYALRKFYTQNLESGGSPSAFVLQKEGNCDIIYNKCNPSKREIERLCKGEDHDQPPRMVE